MNKNLTRLIILFLAFSAYLFAIGNHENININDLDHGLTSSNYYWVGDNGNWSNPSNWATTSGGNEMHLTPPTKEDNVIFDENSFEPSFPFREKTVLLEGDSDFYCRDMIWRTTQKYIIFQGSSDKKLHIHGSLKLSESIDFDFFGNIFFKGKNKGQTIELAGHALLQEAHFDAPQGEWILQDTFRVYNKIQLDNGCLNSNNQTIETELFHSLSNTQRTIVLGSSHVIIKNFYQNPIHPEWIVYTNQLTFDAGTSTIFFPDKGEGFLRSQGTGSIHYHTVKYSSRRGHFFTNSTTTHIDTLTMEEEGRLESCKIDYLKTQPGFSYFFSGNKTFEIGEIQARGDCQSGLTYLRGFNNTTVNFDISKDHILQGVAISGIRQIGTGNLIAEESIDLGLNQNWTFTEELTSRQLFWIGGNGFWEDPQNWSYSSGGPGGACIPTPIDDVIFDENSFTGSNQWTDPRYNTFRYCRDMTWTNVPNNVGIRGFWLEIFGSVKLAPGVFIDVLGPILSGSGNQALDPNGGIFLGELNIFCLDGQYELKGDLIINKKFTVGKGGFISNGFDISADAIQVNNQVPILDLDGSKLTINFFFQINQPIGGFDFGVSNYLVELTGDQPQILLLNDKIMGRFLFSNPDVEGIVTSTSGAKVRFLQFSGNGQVLGNISVDSLIFTPGKSYFFEANKIFPVQKYWEVQGNICGPINLSSTSEDSKATISMPQNSTLLADYVQLKDLTATGGAEFNLGHNSVDLQGNNTGWKFDSIPSLDEKNILGEDRVVNCGEPLTLEVPSYSSNINYEWSTGSTNRQIAVNESGEYWVKVKYSDDCEVIDTVNVSFITQVDLQAIEDFCEAASFAPDINTNIPSELVDSVRWILTDQNENIRFTSTDFQPANVSIDDVGNYRLKVTVFNSCGSFSNDINFNILEPPVADVRLETNLMSLDSPTLGVTNLSTGDNLQFLWSASNLNMPGIEVTIDNPEAFSPTFTFSDTGRYQIQLQVGNNVCGTAFWSDTVLVRGKSDEASNLSYDIPEGFTPDAPGLNQTFILPMLLRERENYPDNRLQIFNRFRQEVYFTKDYQNDWNGVDNNGSPLPAGTYYYLFTYGEKKNIQGIVTIIR